MYNYWGCTQCTSIILPLSYPLRSLILILIFREEDKLKYHGLLLACNGIKVSVKVTECLSVCSEGSRFRLVAELDYFKTSTGYPFIKVTGCLCVCVCVCELKDLTN